jgi:hypothetical protein
MMKPEISLPRMEGGGIAYVGTGISLFKEKIDADLKCKTLKSGNNITLEANASEIITIKGVAREWRSP